MPLRLLDLATLMVLALLAAPRGGLSPAGQARAVTCPPPTDETLVAYAACTAERVSCLALALVDPGVACGA